MKKHQCTRPLSLPNRAAPRSDCAVARATSRAQRPTVEVAEPSATTPVFLQRKCEACAGESEDPQAIQRRADPAIPSGIPVFLQGRQSATTSGLRIQAKSALRVGAPDDAYEREADAVADRVMRMPDRTDSMIPGSRSLQRKLENEGPVLNAEAASSAPGDAASATASVDSVLRSPGQTLDTPTRASFEPRLGWGLSGVQIHTDPAAQRSARDVQGHGYTVGQHIVFGAGRFAPGTGAVGRRLLDMPANVTP